MPIAKKIIKTTQNIDINIFKTNNAMSLGFLISRSIIRKPLKFSKLGIIYLNLGRNLPKVSF
jgi:hypothetical protein